MPNIKLYQRSFAGGEISQEMFGRIDDVKYQTGAALMRNMIATPQGPLENRPGFQYVRETKTSARKSRLIPFTYSTDQTLALEFGVNSDDSLGYVRFHTQGGTLLQPSTGIPNYKTFNNNVTLNDSTNDVEWNSHPYQVNDPVFFTTTGALPSQLSANTVYYVQSVATNSFKIKATKAGTLPLIFGSGQTGTQGVYYYREQGELVFTAGANFYFRKPSGSTYANPATGPNATSADWYLMPSSGEYEVPTPYKEADLFNLHYAQSADVLTVVHPAYQPLELRRLGATQWTINGITFGTSLTTPTSVAATPTLGSYNAISTYNNSANVVASFTTVGTHNLLEGDPVYITGMGNGGNRLKVGPSGAAFSSGFFVVATIPSTTTFTLKDYATGTQVYTAIASGTSPAYVSGDGKVTYWARISDTFQRYVVTAINDRLEESPQSAEAACENNLFVSGAYNTISWAAVPGATRYNVYKKQSGLYGFIGQTVQPPTTVPPTAATFVDDNIAPDMGVTPPIYDTGLTGAGNYPAAVTYYEQRRCFGGTTNAPQGVWMTRSATESDLSYSIPTQDTDRIAFRIAAREANTIRHMVPLQQLVLLTNSAEWRVTSVNNDALTPFSLSVRPQSYIGANNVQPSIINTSLVYCAARGGHVREMGYSWQNNGYITGDLSLRAAHLFDGYNISDMTYGKAPKPLLWFVSSTGKLLGLTYIPEEQVGAWHQHDTAGTFESCAAIPEGDEDSLYVIVRRTINGNSKRYVERMSTRNFSSLEASFFVDSGRTFNGANTDPAKTVTLSGGSQWVANELVTVTASAPGIFTGSTDVGDAIVVTGADGTKYKVLITQYTSATVVQGKLDKALPAALRNVATSNYAFARDTVSGLSHLEDMDVSVLADGVVLTGKKVQSGAIALGAPYSLVHVGLPYDSDLQTVPVTFQAEAFGKGVFKNINKVVISTFQSSTFYVGPNAALLVKSDPYAASPGFDSTDVDVVVQPRWNWTGQTYVRQADPLPLTITSICYEAVIGGS